ncbi:helix-turn-helix transcriptional regulator [Bacillus litorisediminis]|uniref:helix-turn-helix transcriptional regulator n=1 Tax=Bacillus litorisediminis TaxID=2922713 RepID=UPI001FAEF9AD|nr:helix-turn-helix transcriptional regulator [Bacillus litorisediminis]
MKIGERIRFYRLQQNKTQEELASGIISVSYLSKIENNQCLPSVEVLTLLCSRLNISLHDGEESNIHERLKDWYKSIINRDKDFAAKEYEELKGIINQKDSTSLLYFMMFELRFHLLNRNIHSAVTQIERLQEYTTILSGDLLYYFLKFQALCAYLQNQFTDAYEKYKKAEGLLASNVFEKWEEADLYYSIALTSSRLWKVSICLRYTNQALGIYQAIYDFKRSAECQVLLGISYQRSGEWKKAEESLLLTSKIADSLNDINLKGMVHHNLGYLFSLQEKSDLAIEHYTKSIEYRNHGDDTRKLHTIFSLVMEYYKVNDFDKALTWVHLAFTILESLDQKLTEYEYHFKTYYYLLNRCESEEFENFMKDEVIPYFAEHNMYEYLATYAEILATYYEKAYRYKLSSQYFRVSNDALRNIYKLV